MAIETIRLDALRSHPRNSNVMPPELFEKLVRHMERTGRYPPVIVRALAASPGEAVGYEILDGHHRVAALRRLGRAGAQCVVWDVDEEEALLLLATLNRLQGTDDPRRRGELLAGLAQTRDLPALLGALPESRERLERLLSLAREAPPPRPSRVADRLPVAVHFFLLPAQKRALEDRLATVGGTREAALMTLVGLTGATNLRPETSGPSGGEQE